MSDEHHHIFRALPKTVAEIADEIDSSAEESDTVKKVRAEQKALAATIVEGSDYWDLGAIVANEFMHDLVGLDNETGPENFQRLVYTCNAAQRAIQWDAAGQDPGEFHPANIQGANTALLLAAVFYVGQQRALDAIDELIRSDPDRISSWLENRKAGDLSPEEAVSLSRQFQKRFQ